MCGWVEVFVAIFWCVCVAGGGSHTLFFSSFFPVFRFKLGGGGGGGGKGDFLKTKAPFSRPTNFSFSGGGGGTVKVL